MNLSSNLTVQANVVPQVDWNGKYFSHSWTTINLEKHQLILFEDFFYDSIFYDMHNTEDPYTDFFTPIKAEYFEVKQASITTFFSTNLIDMPICFNKSKSLYTKTFQIPLLKFTNLIMRNGFQTRTLKIITQSFSRLLLNLPSKKTQTLTNWLFLFKTFHSSWLSERSESPINILPGGELKLGQHVRVSPVDYSPKNIKRVFSDFLLLLEEYLPVFGFFIRRVNKDLRKNSRGKSGKYTIIWKYVPVYKRLYLTMRWFLKDLKFQPQRVIKFRFYQLLENLFFTPELSFVFKSRRFVHHYVFKNFKKTLLTTLKSV